MFETGGRFSCFTTFNLAAWEVIEIIGKGTICKKSLLLAGKSQKSANLYIWKRFIHF